MFAYYFKLGLRSLRRNPALTALMVITLAVGVAASVSTLTILHMMSSDPIPHKSARLFVPLIDPDPLDNYTPGQKQDDIQITYPDAMNILKSGLGVRRTALYGVAGSVEPPRREIPPFNMGGLAPTRDFFAMFDVPFAYGQAWTEADEARGADVVVLSRPMAEKLYGDVVGVTEKWKMLPRVYLLQGGSPYATGEEFFIPLATAVRHETQHNGGMSCSGNIGPGFAARLASDCTWVTAWIEAASAGDRSEIQSWLDSYASQQRKLGRLKRNAPNRLFDVPGWMEYTGVVGKDAKLQTWLAFGFLALCLVNTIGLLLAKFSVRASEIGVRRALGASRTEIFRQFLIETVVVGLVGGVLGLLLAVGALKLIALSGKAMANLAQMDWQMLGLTFVISVFAAVLAGLLPTWRACQVTPAIQLKSQ